MTVTVVCDVLGRENNGTTIAAMNLIRSLKKKGHTVRVICPDSQRRAEEGFYIVDRFNVGPFNGYVEKNGVALSKPDRKIIREALLGADVVHVMIPFALGIATAKEAAAMGIPVTAGFHCQAENFSNHIFLMNAPAANRAIYRFFYRHLYSKCRCVHYPTQFICSTFENIVGPTNHYIISNGVGSAFVPMSVQRPEWLPEDRFTVLFTGRYSREKSHGVLIDAVALSAHRNEIQLVFAGSGPQRDNIRKHAERQGINMPIMRFFSRDELLQVINSSDLYVHPAEIEIEAIACLEAIACGLVPVVSDSPRSATGAFALTPENLFHCGDTADLARKIDYWLENPEKREQCSKMYQGFGAGFNSEICMDKMERMLLDAVQKEA